MYVPPQGYETVLAAYCQLQYAPLGRSSWVSWARPSQQDAVHAHPFWSECPHAPYKTFFPLRGIRATLQSHLQGIEEGILTVEHPPTPGMILGGGI